jgi:RNA polymerase sigma factor (TIGR02999 family)
MNDVTHILSAIERGDPKAAEQLLPLLYDELHRRAAQRLAQETPGQTLQPTALVHEAYLRFFGSGTSAHWDGCGHLFAAAAEAMRRILVEQARRKRSLKRGGGRRRESADLDALLAGGPAPDVLALHEALEELAAHDPVKAKLVELRFFAGLTLDQAAECLGIAPRTADRAWRYARAWLYTAIAGPDSGEK